MMGRSPYSDGNGLKKGPWTPEEDRKLVEYIEEHGHGSWRALPKLAGLNRCGKSCRLRWTNYLRPDIKRGKFSEDEEKSIINLHSVLGNKWSVIATHLPGRTDNEIKNFWNTHLKKKLLKMGIDPVTHRPRTDLSFLTNFPQFLAATAVNLTMPTWDNNNNNNINDNGLTEVTQLAKIHLLHNILQLLNAPPSNLEALNLLGLSSWDNLVNKYLQINSQFEGNHDYLIPQGFAQQEISLSNPSSLPNSSDQLHHHHYDDDVQQANLVYTNNTITSHDDHDHDHDHHHPNLQAASNQLPSLVSASPEPSPIIQNENKLNSIHISNPTSSTSTTFATWDHAHLLDDEAGDSYWTDIIEQASSQSWS